MSVWGRLIGEQLFFFNDMRSPHTTDAIDWSIVINVSDTPAAQTLGLVILKFMFHSNSKTNQAD